MSLTSYARLDHSPVEITIFEFLNRVAGLMDSHGVQVKTHTKKALYKLESASRQKKMEVLERLSVLDLILSDLEVSRLQSGSDHPERKLVERALDVAGLKLKHQDFWDNLAKDEMIEVYNNEDIQIFRSLNFFRTSSYSLLDLLLNEWFQLWERPSSVLQEMFNVVQKIRSGEITKVTPCGVSEHIFKEIYNAEDTEEFVSRSSLIQFNVICPLYDIKNDEKLAGFIVTSRIVPVALGEETKTIAFI